MAAQAVTPSHTSSMETPLLTALRLVNHALTSLQQHASSSASSTTTGPAIDSLQLAASLLTHLDPYLDAHSSRGPPALAALIAETQTHDWKGAYERGDVSFPVHPGWSAGAYEGTLIAMIARAIGARRVLEVGMFTGTTTLCVADALPQDGKLITLELDPYFERLASPYFDQAGVRSRIQVRTGKALDALHAMVAQGEEPFDLIFVDADKGGYAGYYGAIMEGGLLRRGGVLLVDNTLYKGVPFTPELANAHTRLAQDLNLDLANGAALQAFNKLVADDDRVEASVLPIRDGITWIMHRKGA